YATSGHTGTGCPKSTPLKLSTVCLNHTSNGACDWANPRFAAATSSPSIRTMPTSPIGVCWIQTVSRVAPTERRDSSISAARGPATSAAKALASSSLPGSIGNESAKDSIADLLSGRGRGEDHRRRERFGEPSRGRLTSARLRNALRGVPRDPRGILIQEGTGLTLAQAAALLGLATSS